MLKLLRSLLEYMGRKKVFATFTGVPLNNRWYLGYVETDDDARPIARLPNLYLHQNLQPDSPDGPDEHYHAWNTWSLIISGGYWQSVDGVETFYPRWSIVRVRHTQHHRIVRCLPNTWSLFFHGWRVSAWRIKVDACATLCDTCRPKGACYAGSHDIPYEVYFAGESGKYRRGRWFTASPGLERTLRLRRAAVARLGDKLNTLSRDDLNARICEEMTRVKTD